MAGRASRGNLNEKINCEILFKDPVEEEDIL